MSSQFYYPGPKPSSLIDLDGSNLLIYSVTCSGDLKGMINFVF